jgi:glycosyltransferase involved in cell wall biosynthesis
MYVDVHYRVEELNIKGVPWHASTEVDMLNSFDIGVMPLPNDEWAKGKCGLKALSYMACGVATVMSAVGVNVEIATDGAALLANTKDEWMSALEKLINDKALRQELGKKGRRAVVERYSVEAHKERYLELFKALL